VRQRLRRLSTITACIVTPVLTSGLAGAQSVFKCTDSAGRVIYSDTACVGTKRTVIDVSGHRSNPERAAAERERWALERSALESRELARAREDSRRDVQKVSDSARRPEAEGGAAQSASCNAAREEVRRHSERRPQPPVYPPDMADYNRKGRDLDRTMRSQCGLPEPEVSPVAAPPPPPPPVGPKWTTVTDQKGRTYDGFLDNGMGFVTPSKGRRPCTAMPGFVRCD
jgi:hypothetical protein